MRLLKSLNYRIQYFFGSVKRQYSVYRSLPAQVAFVDNKIFRGMNETDISDHLNTIFALAMSKKPRTILELGTRGGESTKVLSLVANQIGAKGYSVDLSEAPVWLNEQKNWQHFVADDTEFSKSLIDSWPNGDTYSGIDLLFLDTSHLYEHTIHELNLYWELINENGILILHDTNCTSVMTRRLSGSTNFGWDNKRGVIQAIEEFFECSIDENSLVSIDQLGRGAKSLTHFPWNNGLTVIFK
jgi:predicted O-methyltransferase YrrM